MQQGATRRINFRWHDYVIASALCIISIFAVQNAFTQVAAQEPATFGRPFAMHSPPAVEARLQALASGNRAEISPRSLLRMAREALRADPLSSRAPFAAAVALAQLGNYDLAERAMALAVRRDPRNIAAHQWLVERRLRSRQYPDALRELDAIMRLRPALSSDITRVMVNFLRAPGMVEAFAEMGSTNPPWLPVFLDHAARDPEVAPELYSLMRELGSDSRVLLPVQSVSQVAQAALSRGDTMAAVSLYRAFFPASANAGSDAVFDGSFQGLAGAAPFSWTFHSTLSGDAFRSEDGGLQVSVRSGAATDLVTQAIVISPGDYQIRSDVRQSNLIGSRALYWQVRCTRDGHVITELPIPSNVQRLQSVSSDLTVETGCEALIIALVGGDDSASGDAQIDAISVTRIGNASQ